MNLLLLQLLSSRLEVPVTGTVRWSFWPGTLRLDTLRLLKDARGAPVLRGDVRVFFNPLALVLSRDVELRLEASRVQPLFLSGVLTQELYEALGPLQVKGSLIISRDGVTVRALDAQAAGARLHLAGQVAAKGNLDLRSSVTLQEPLVAALPPEVVLSLFGPEPPAQSGRLIDVEVAGSLEEPHVTLASEFARLEVTVT